MGKYYSFHGIIKEITIVIGVVLLITAASATVYFGMFDPVTSQKPSATQEPVSVPAIPTYEPVIESVADQMFRTNGHYLGDVFTWRRDDVSGTKDMIVHAMIYGYRFEPNYQWWSVSWGRYFIQVPEDGMKYAFVYAKVWMEGNSTNWDPRIYGFDTSHFKMQIGQTLYDVDPSYLPPLRIKELEETWNGFNNTRIEPFGCLRINDAGKESCIFGQWIRMGNENGQDGFMVFQVPAATRPEDITILGSFRGFGDAWWQLA